MKSKLFILFIFAMFSLNAQQMFYYYQGNKINLTVDKNYVNIIVNDDFQKSSDTNFIYKHFVYQHKDNASSSKIVRLQFKTTPSELEYVKILDILKQNLQIKYVFPCFERTNAEPIGISDIFYLKLKEVKDTTLLKNIAQQQKVQIVKQVPYMHLWYILSIQNSVFSNTVDASNYFYETRYFEDIDPAFMFNFKADCTDDSNFSGLWGLNNTLYSGIDINICNAWAITRGSGIKVSIIDRGIDFNHRDLASNIHFLSFDAKSGTSPSVFIDRDPPYCNHGTHIAGTIASLKNDLDVVGVAPESKIMGVSHDFEDSHSNLSAELASGISWAWQNSADIISNSWGDDGGNFYNSLHSSILENAIIDAMTQGRNNKGCIIVFASGNNGFKNRLNYPGNFHNGILTVGSIDINGNRSYFSNCGDELDVVAPGRDILSTIPNNHIDYMTGTSMATPHVAGVASLVLSINPSLTRQDVCNIIESTAKKIGNPIYDPYQNTQGHPNGLWSSEMGYGLIDAYYATQAACATTYNFINQNVDTDTTITSCGDINVQDVSVTSGTKLELDAAGEVTIDGDFEIELGSELEIK